jgi:hypothetical protein
MERWQRKETWSLWGSRGHDNRLTLKKQSTATLRPDVHHMYVEKIIKKMGT